jgi:capsular polysaccharide biosynthesis protein
MSGADVARDSELDVVNRLHWGVRRYFPVLVLTVSAAVMLSLARPASGPRQTYDAAALVVATSLEIDALQLPRTVDAVFGGGSVAESVSSKLPEVGPADLLIPDVIRVEPLNDTVVVRVIGRSRQPSTAANLANEAAMSLVAELNELGPGVGEFVVQDAARLPLRRDDGSSPLTSVAIGVLSGGALGLGIVVLLLVMRRPVIASGEAAAVVGAPLLASLQLPRRRRHVEHLGSARRLSHLTRQLAAAIVVGPPLLASLQLPRRRRHVEHLESVSGLSQLTRQLLPADRPMCALVGIGSDTRARLEVMRLVAFLLSRTGKVVLVVPVSDQGELSDRTRSASNVTVIDSWFMPPVNPGGAVPGVGDQGTVVLFGLSAVGLDVPQVLPAGIRTVLFVAQGAPREQLESVVDQFGPDGVDGTVFVRRLSWWQRRPN